MILRGELDRTCQSPFGTHSKVGGWKDLIRDEAIEHLLQKGHHRSLGVCWRPKKFGEILFDQIKPLGIPGEASIINLGWDKMGPEDQSSFRVGLVEGY